MSVDPGEMLWVTLQGQPGGPSCSRCLGDRTGARRAASGKQQNVLEQAGLQALSLEPEESGCLPACPPAASLSLGWSHFLLAISAPGRAAGLGMWHTGHRSAVPPGAPWARLAHTPPPHRSRNEHMLRPALPADGHLAPATAAYRVPHRPQPCSGPVWEQQALLGKLLGGRGPGPVFLQPRAGRSAPDHSRPLAVLCVAPLAVSQGWTRRARPGKAATPNPPHYLAAISPGSRIGHPPGHLRLQTVTFSLRGQHGKRTCPRLMAGLAPGASRWRAAATGTKVARLGSGSGTWRAAGGTGHCRWDEGSVEGPGRRGLYPTRRSAEDTARSGPHHGRREAQGPS